MIKFNDPRQTLIFDRFESLLNPKQRARLEKDWPGVFRKVILALMPVAEMGQKLNTCLGRPSQELYSICGLILLKEYFGWTDEMAAQKYSYDLMVQYALNIQGDQQDISERTFQRYLKYFREKELGVELNLEVTRKVLSELNIKVGSQRLDSTHVFSDMASWGRIQLMANIIKRFLVQINKHENTLYYQIPEELRERYSKNMSWIFGAPGKQNTRYGNHICSNKEQTGWDMQRLIERFEGNERIVNMLVFKDLVRVFNEQCLIDDGKVKIREKTGGEALINPSDRDAAWGHKGPGYQVQVSQTCDRDNLVQVVTALRPETGSASDQNAVMKMIDLAEAAGAKPASLLADAGYGSDENVISAAGEDVKLVAPATGSKDGKFGLEDFTFDDKKRIVKCPCGHAPMSKKFDGTSGTAVFYANVCGACPKLNNCPSSKSGNNYVVKYDAKKLRLKDRRIFEKTDEFKKEYSPRSGIEPLFGRMKQYGPLRCLAVCGKKAVYNALYMIFAGHNIMQLARYYKLLSKGANKRNKKTVSPVPSSAFCSFFCLGRAFSVLIVSMQAFRAA